MSDTPKMPEEARVTIRLSPELYAQLQASGSHGQPLAAIGREALVAYLTRQPTEPKSFAELAMTVAAMAATLDGLQEQVEALAARVETLATGGQPTTARTRQPEPPRAADTSQPRTVGGQRKLTPRQQRALRDKHQRGVPVPALMEEYGLSRASVFRYLQSEQRAGGE
jgi:transposase